MDLRKKKVMVLAEDLFNEMELWYPYYRLQEAGAEVTLVGSGASKTFLSRAGLPVWVDASADEVSAADFDAVVIPGVVAPDRMRRHPAMVGLVRDLYESGKVVAGICHAGWMLASAGILEGRRVTSGEVLRDELEQAGAEWVDRGVVVDGNLITSRQPADLPDFVRAIVERMSAECD